MVFYAITLKIIFSIVFVMKIALVYDMIYPESIGGAEFRNYLLAKELSKENEVHVFSYRFGKDKVFERENVFYHGVRMFDGIYSFNGKRKAFEPLFFAFSLLYGLKKSKIDFDIIDVSSFPYFPALMLLDFFKSKAKIVVLWHEFWDDYWDYYVKKPFSFIGKRIERRIARKSKNNIFVSDLTKKRFLKVGKLQKNNLVIPNFISCSHMDNIKASDMKSDFVFVGRLMEHKNLEIIVHAIMRIKEKKKDVKCFIIGDGYMYSKIEAMIFERNLERNIIMLGKIADSDEVYSIMKASSVFLFPSSNEGFGIAALEALFFGLPVATIDFEMNATKDLITDETGSVVKSLDLSRISDLRYSISQFDHSYSSLVERYSNAAFELLSKCSLMSSACRKRAEDYDVSKIVPRIVLYYKKAV